MTRDLGLALHDLALALEGVRFPATREALASARGEAPVRGLGPKPVPLARILRSVPFAEASSPEEVTQAFLSVWHGPGNGGHAFRFVRGAGSQSGKRF